MKERETRKMRTSDLPAFHAPDHISGLIMIAGREIRIVGNLPFCDSVMQFWTPSSRLETIIADIMIIIAFTAIWIVVSTLCDNKSEREGTYASRYLTVLMYDSDRISRSGQPCVHREVVFSVGPLKTLLP